MDIWTVGHAHDSYETFAHRLDEFEIELLVDVRSRPFIQFAHHLDRPRLEEWAAEQGLGYEYRGEDLGGRPYGDGFYDDEGHTLYEPLTQQPNFIGAIADIEATAGRQCAALLCLEEEPERCHRFHLLGHVLARNGHQVIHIRRGGEAETQLAVGQRLGVGQQALLDGETWRSPEPMRRGHNVPEHD